MFSIMKRLKTIISLMALAFVFSMNANAAIEYTFQEGINTIEAYKGFTATYTVKTDGNVEIATLEGLDRVACGDKTYTYSWVPAATWPYTYEVEAKAGDVITLSMGFNMQSQIRITENAKHVIPIEFITCSPNANRMFSWNTAGHVSLLFSKPVVLEDVVLKANGKSYAVSSLNCSNGNVGFNITYALNDAYKDGLKDNEEFTIELTGIADAADPTNKYKSDGKLVLKYTAPSTQHNMVKAAMNGKEFKEGSATGVKFLSFFGSDGEDGVFTIEFDDNISAVGDCYLSMGNIDQDPVGKYFRESLRPEISGNKITVDFRGKLRTLARMFPAINIDEIDPNDRLGAFDHEHISLRIGNVKDSKGNPFYTSLQGNIGSYSFVFNYEEIVDNIVMDGDRETDAEGCKKSDGSDVQLWIDQQVKSIDGVKLYIQVDNGQAPDEETQAPVYATGQVNINKSDIKIVSSDPSDGTVLSFNLPELKALVTEGGEVEEPQEKEYSAVSGTNIRLVLMVTTANGMPHDLVINYVYEEPTGIKTVETAEILETSETTLFNLAGQKVDEGYRGIVIKNGKKVLR